MIDPKLILATKPTPAGAKVLILIDGKKKWVWRDKKETKKPVDNWNEHLSR